MMDVEKYKNLERKLARCEEDLQLSARIGKELLDENVKLKSTIETLQQEKYDLKILYESNRKSLDYALEDHLEEYKENLNEKYSELNFKREIENSKIVENLNSEICTLHSELEHFKDSETRAQQRIAVLEKDLNDMKDITLGGHTTTFTLSSDLLRLEEEKAGLVRQNEELGKENTTLRKDLDCLIGQEMKLKDDLEILKSNLRDKEIDLKSYVTSLKAVNEEVGELKMEIEALKLADTDLNRKGNSLFSEVEDRRKKQEQKLTQMHAQYEASLQDNAVLQQQLSKQRLKYSNLLSANAGKFDATYVEHLDSSLKDAKAEIIRLTNQLKQQEQLGKEEKGRRLSSTGDDYAYLTAMLNKSKKHAEDLEKDLQVQRLVHWTDTEKISQIQKKNVESEQVLGKLKSEILMLRSQIDEYKIKCKHELRPEIRREVKECVVKEKIQVQSKVARAALLKERNLTSGEKCEQQ